ncbi:30S ribosomal protein S18 [Serpentinicella alkaliphila]|nr:30S ribosomal protein S18 [Serpentinicella alkaliphila]
MKVINKKRRRTKKKVCIFCADKINHIDYKDVQKLKKYITERGKIIPRRISGNCAIHQRALTIALKRSRQMALLPYSVD